MNRQELEKKLVEKFQEGAYSEDMFIFLLQSAPYDTLKDLEEKI